MDYNSLSDSFKKIKNDGSLDSVVTIYSVIGGYLAPSYKQIESLHQSNDVPLIIDTAHAHYLESIISSSYPSMAFSFYATKILPSGEGGLISTSDDSMFNWIKKFLIYDRFEYELEVGINLRANELTSYFIYKLMTETKYKDHFVDNRVKIADKYKVCLKHDIKFLDHNEADGYNGYKFIVAIYVHLK